MLRCQRLHFQVQIFPSLTPPHKEENDDEEVEEEDGKLLNPNEKKTTIYYKGCCFTYQHVPAQQPKRDHLQAAASHAFLPISAQQQHEQPDSLLLARGGMHMRLAVIQECV